MLAANRTWLYQLVMPPVVYRQVERNDLPAMARIRAANAGTEAHWFTRISDYLDGKHRPQQALMLRVIFVAVDNDSLIGFVAGHLTRRHGCDGELQWIDVVPQWRGGGVASELLRQMASWFVEQNACRICVNVDPANARARRFYQRHGAAVLNEHWLVWDNIASVSGL